MLGGAMLALAACGANGPKDWDLRGMSGGGFDTAPAAQRATLDRPTPDSRGIISYPGYQVVVAKRGDTVAGIASRLNLSAAELGRFNGIAPTASLTEGEVVALPTRVAEPSAATGAPLSGMATGGDTMPPPAGGGQIDISTLATGAIDRAQATQPATTATTAQIASNSSASVTTAPNVLPKGKQPLRHKVARGETAYTIARLYNIPVRALADWNGLGANLSVHEGQYLLIPLVDESKPVTQAAVTPPGQPSPLSEPPSASKPLPTTTPPAASAVTPVPASPNLGKDRTVASSKFIMPMDGKIIRGYDKKAKHEGVDIAGSVGSTVSAAADGTVAVITTTPDGVTFVAIKHPNGLMTSYAPVQGVKVKKGEHVKRGQAIATLGTGNPQALVFQVYDSHLATIDPSTVLQ
ncbi:MAG: LysM peptidoglycan-binding domain-containing M23 family metallopeptidase [Paracoccaceae bacterium]|nr:LysM peptidoglycan-binding domain-containing M23 family metallopeptidase [Paracoccaceae bacterium]